MPIRLENKARYPDNWKLISKFVRFIRAKNKCEWCGIPNYAVGYRDDDGKFQACCGSIEHGYIGQGLIYPGLRQATYKEARFIANELNESEVKLLNSLLGEKEIPDFDCPNCQHVFVIGKQTMPTLAQRQAGEIEALKESESLLTQELNKAIDHNSLLMTAALDLIDFELHSEFEDRLTKSNKSGEGEEHY